ncbi:ribonuclease H2 subunit B isoform X2 [Protopterus annectens]|uniref:ribonuclease H2 subunit B isoform X2 n=1 Tax=Protopterus annectens TaxID=7888 RepID=UPI001CFAD90C|nr:ribonuclease H2 subunit B isoform X2 [Protopterus annectens]
MLCKKKWTPNVPGDHWVLLAKESVIDAPKSKSAESGPVFTRLRSPCTGEAALYLLGSNAGQIYEVKAFNEEYHSWFIGQVVQHDGRLMLVTPMDPLFLVLPYLSKAEQKGKFQPIDQVVKDEDFPCYSSLLQCPRISQSLHHVTEEKEIGSQKFYKYSKDKTMTWLKKKVDQTVSALKKMSISVGGGVQSATFIRNTTSDLTEEDYIRYAHGLVSEYLEENMSHEFLKYLKLPELTSPVAEPPQKPSGKMTSAQKALAKVDKTGMKNISSFFGPKTKSTK